MLTLCGLYVAQGIPWGFVTVTFAAWLAQPQHNLTTEQIGPILAVATLPWSFKFLWGPIMDRFPSRRWGRRRPWILFAQAMAIMVLGAMLLIDDLPGMVWSAELGANGEDASVRQNGWGWAVKLVPGPLAAMILLANVFISMQDVAVDALAVDLLSENERGIANGLMYGSSYLGTAIGGAGLGLVVSRFGIEAGLAGQALMLSLIMLLPACFRERPASDPANDSALAPPCESPPCDVDADQIGRVDFGEMPMAPLTDSKELRPRRSVVRDLVRAFSLRSTIVGAVVALTIKLGVGVLTAVFVDYLMKDGGWTQQEYTSVVGGYAVALGLGGSALGGWIADRVGVKRLILSVSLTLGATWLAFGCFPSWLESKPAVSVLLLAQEFLLAVITVCLFTMFMGISWPRVAATQFTTYMALMNLSTTLGSYAAGTLTGGGWNVSQILMIAGVCQCVFILPVLTIDLGQARRVLGET